MVGYFWTHCFMALAFTPLAIEHLQLTSRQ